MTGRLALDPLGLQRTMIDPGIDPIGAQVLVLKFRPARAHELDLHSPRSQPALEPIRVRELDRGLRPQPRRRDFARARIHMGVKVARIAGPVRPVQGKINGDVVAIRKLAGERAQQLDVLCLVQLMRQRNLVLARDARVFSFLGRLGRIPQRLAVSRPVDVQLRRRAGQHDLGMLDPAAARVIEALIDAAVIEPLTGPISRSGHRRLSPPARDGLMAVVIDRHGLTLLCQTS